MDVQAADGTRVTVRRTGRGRPVVLVHGSAGGLDSWDPIVPLLAEDFELWGYARRGYAPSAAGTRPKTFTDDVGDLRAVLDAAGGSAAVVGASYGATVALHAARDPSPGLTAPGIAASGITALALFEPPLYAAGAAVASVLGPYRALVEAGDLPAAARLFAERVARVPAPLLAALAAADPGADPAPDPGAVAEAVGCLHDLEAMAADTGDVGRWAAIGVPVLLLQGGDTWDPMPATMDALAAVLPDASRVVWPGQSHFATHTAPDRFADAVRQFMEP